MTQPAPAVKAIETRYAGCRFRSRLEARWAVFFDNLGVPWQYEPEGFDLKGKLDDALLEHKWIEGGYYLPDFYLPTLDTWYEVKGSKPTRREYELAWLLEESTQQRVVMAWGDIPRNPDPWGRDQSSAANLRGVDVLGDHDYAWCVCPWCGQPGIEFDARSARIHGYKVHGLTDAEAWQAIEGKPEHWRIDDKCYSGNDPRILTAFDAARSARFEHGEAG
jgi:hypothetical protein